MVKEYRYYTYKVTFKDLPKYFYYGRKKDHGKPYFGSPKTFRHLWDFFEPEVQILCWYRTAKEAREAEDALIGHTWKQEWNGRRYSLNRNKGGLIDEGVCRENAKNIPKETCIRNGKTNVKKIPKRTLSENGKNNVERMNQHPNTVEAKKRNGRERGRETGKRNGKKQSKKVMCVETKVVYPSTMEVERKTSIRNGSISQSARSNGKIAAGGYHWVYLD